LESDREIRSLSIRGCIFNMISEPRPMTARRLTTAILLLVLGTGPVSAQPTSSQVNATESVPARLTTPFKPIVAKATNSTVWVVCNDKDAALGTVVFDDGYILTKASELRGEITVRTGDGKKFDAILVSVHKPTDLALLKIKAKNLKPVTFADSKKVPLGNWLAAAGPSGDPISVGVVSVITRKFSGLEASSTINRNRGVIGVRFAQDLDIDDEPKVDEVSPRSAASKVGMKRNDIICEIEGTKVTSIKQIHEILDEFRPGEIIHVKVKRKGEVVDLDPVKLGKQELDAERNREEFQNTMGNKLSGRRTGFPSILQTDMILDPEKCGGPVVDLDGNVLGINIARAGRVETWILPGEVIRPLLNDLKAGKYPPISIRKEHGTKADK